MSCRQLAASSVAIIPSYLRQLVYPVLITYLIGVQCHYHHRYHREPKRYSFYTFRTARADDGEPNGGKTFYNSPTVTSTSAPSSPPVLPSQILAGNSVTVIKHPGTCTYDRSHAACTFSLLCYLANGVPVEGCEENTPTTCCILQAKNIMSRAQGKSDTLPPTITIYRHYPAPTPTSESTSPSGTTLRPTFHTGSFHQPPPPPSPVSNSISNFYVPSGNFLSSTYTNLPSDSTTNKHSIEAKYQEYNNQKDLKPTYETNQFNGNKLDNDNFNNAIRRTRTESINSIFHEIANRKLYARNYDIEDSKWFIVFKEFVR